MTIVNHFYSKIFLKGEAGCFWRSFVLGIYTFLVCCNTKHKETGKTLEDEKYDKILKTLDITGCDKAQLKTFIKIGEGLNNDRDLDYENIITNNKNMFGQTYLGLNNIYNTKVNDSGSKAYNDKKAKDNTKYKREVNKFCEKIITKNKVWVKIVFALTLGILFSLSILGILTGGIFFILIGLMFGMLSFRLFRKLKEELTPKPVKREEEKSKHKNKVVTKASGKKSRYTKRPCLNSIEPQKTKKQKMEFGFFVTMSLIVALILSASFLGIISVLIAPALIATIGGMAAFRRVKLLCEGRL